MARIMITNLVILVVINNILSLPSNSYMDMRNKVLQSENQRRIGSSITLSPAEVQVNNLLMQAKISEINASRATNGPTFAPSVNFLVGKPLVEKSSVFQMIRKMPKGAALHLHDCSMVDLHWLVKVATYMPHCYMCHDNSNKIYFHFYKSPPSNPSCPWVLVDTQRKKATSVKDFDEMLYRSMSMIVDDPQKAYPNLSAVWKEFLRVLDVANGLINYAPVFGMYFTEALAEFDRDNVQYLENRGLLPETYNLDGSTNDGAWAMQTYVQTIKQYVTKHSNFSGARIIHSGLRIFNNSVILQQVKDSINYLQKYPKYFAGFDLVGQEDPGIPLVQYIDALLYPSRQTPPIKLPYFFHAGETDWQGTATDNNLIDAVLLNTSRIGHGYAIPKHPTVMKMVQQNNIAVEVNPISNQVLKLIDDIQNHPASVLISEGFPVVISSDDPAVWGASGLSYDFYMTFMALTGADADLRLLKQLAINSLLYSSMLEDDKRAALSLWEVKWDEFINSTLQEHYYSVVQIGK